MNKSIKYYKLSDKNYKKIIKDILRHTTHIFCIYEEALEYNFINLGVAINYVPFCIANEYNIKQNEKCLCYNDNEKYLCYTIKYHMAVEVFDKFDSLYEFMDSYKIYNMWFIKNENILMHAEIEYNCYYIFTNYNRP